MVMRTAGHRHTAETVLDLVQWVEALEGAPEIARTKQAMCHHESHGDEPATWFYAEADSVEGVARLRCLAGGHVQHILDSEQRWTFPHMWSCVSCSQAIAEIVYGVHVENAKATWVVLAARCVECGDVAGLTDIVITPTDLDEFVDSL